MKTLPAIITVTWLLLNTAYAAPATQSFKKDIAGAPCETLRSVPYQTDAVATIRAKRGFVTQILLGPGEVILDKRGGDTEGWEVADLQGQGILTLKPRSNATDSNLIVTTDHRVYVMALNVLPNTSACAGNWQVSFKLPPPPVVAVITETPEMLAAKQAAKQAQEAARQAAKLKEDMKAVPSVFNENYSMQAARASDDIVPNAVHDDGRFTYMKFYGNRELPAVFRVAADGEEITVNRHMQGRDVVVLHEVAKRWVLRLNRQAVGIWNDSFDISGVPPVAGTVSDQVQRITNGKELGDE